MNDLGTTRELLTRQLDDAVAADPLHALTAIAAVQRDVATRQSAAVRAAARTNSWTEIGAALGVSKQAAHQKYAKPWAEELKSELKQAQTTMKTALHDGDYASAGVAKARLDALVDEFKQSARKSRKPR